MNRLYKTLFFLCFCLQVDHSLYGGKVDFFAQAYDQKNGNFILHENFSRAFLIKRKDTKYIEVKLDFIPSAVIPEEADTFMPKPTDEDDFLKKFYKQTLSTPIVSVDDQILLDFYDSVSSKRSESLDVLSDEQKQRYSRGVEVQFRVDSHIVKAQSALYKQFQTGDFEIKQKWFSPKPELIRNKIDGDKYIYGALTTLTIHTVEGPSSAEKKEDVQDAISVAKDSDFSDPESDQLFEGYTSPVGFTNTQQHLNYYPSLLEFLKMVYGRTLKTLDLKFYEAQINNDAATARSNMY